MIPDPDRGDRWSETVAAALAGDSQAIRDAVGAGPPIGAVRAAARLSERTGLEITSDDVELLAERSLLPIVDTYKGWPLYACLDLDRIGVPALSGIVADRVAWLAASLSGREAAAVLGWNQREFDRVAVDRGLRPGRLRRFARAVIDQLVSGIARTGGRRSSAGARPGRCTSGDSAHRLGLHRHRGVDHPAHHHDDD